MLQAAALASAASSAPPEIEEKISSLLSRDLRLARREIYGHVEEGRLVVRGWVGSFFEKQLVQEALRRLDGVREICNELEVRPEAEPGRAFRFWAESEELSSEIPL